MKKKKREMFSKMSNKLAYTLIVILCIVLIGIGVYAATYTASGAGHPYTEISTCPSNGQILQMSGGAWTCATISGVTGSQIVSNTNSGCSGNSAVVSCPSGKVILGGGCGGVAQRPISASYPLSATMWQCYFVSGYSGDCTAWVLCST